MRVILEMEMIQLPLISLKVNFYSYHRELVAPFKIDLRLIENMLYSQ